MDKLDEAKQRIALRKTRLERDSKRVKELEQKARLRKKIEFGAMVETVGLLDFDPTVFLGALMEIKNGSSDNQRVKIWQELGAKTSENSDKTDKKPVIVVPKAEISKDIREQLRALKLRWNSFRNEWEGYAIPDEIRSLLKDSQAEVTVCQ